MKVSEIRPDDLMAGQAEAMQKDLDWLAARKPEFVDVPCPACGARNAQPLYEKFGMDHNRCQDCGTQYVNPRPTAETLGEFYSNSENYRYWAKYIFPASREKRRDAIIRPRADIVSELTKRYGLEKGLFVEVGAAHGVFCEEVRDRGLFGELIAIEPTPDMAAECRELGFETIEAPWEKVALSDPAQMIAAFEVIEHLFDPGAFLRWCCDNLVEGGHILLSCPNIEGFETMLLGRASGAVDHEHVNLFNPQSLQALIERSGFDLVDFSTPGELDVELVRRALADNEVDESAVGTVLARLVTCEEPEATRALQDSIKAAGLSSNMVVLARKRDA